MYTTDFNCYARKPLDSGRLAILMGFSIAAFVFYGVNLYLGNKLPKALRGTDHYFLAAALLFMLWWSVIYFKRRFKITVSGNDKRLQLEINDPELNASTVIAHPFIMSRQWIRRRNGEAYIKELYLSFLDQNHSPLVTLKGSLGDLREVPVRFDYIDHNTEDRRLLKISDRIYVTNVKDLEDVLYIHLNYLSAKTN